MVSVSGPSGFLLAARAAIGIRLGSCPPVPSVVHPEDPESAAQFPCNRGIGPCTESGGMGQVRQGSRTSPVNITEIAVRSFEGMVALHRGSRNPSSFRVYLSGFFMNFSATLHNLDLCCQDDYDVVFEECFLFSNIYSFKLQSPLKNISKG